MDDIDSLLSKLELLTEREQEILALRGQAKSISEIAQILVIEVRTVKFHLGNIYEKLGLKNISSTAARLLEIQKYYQALIYVPNTAILTPEPESISESREPEPSQQALVLVLEDELDLIHQTNTAIQRLVTPVPPPIDDQFTIRSRQRNGCNAFMFIAVAIVIGGLIGTGMTVLFYKFRMSPPITSAPSQSPATGVQPSTTEPSLTFSATITNSELTSRVSLCGETSITQSSTSGDFLRSQGVSAFGVDNAAKAVTNDFVRSLAIDQRGVWIGYYATKENPSSGLGLYTKQAWINCNHTAGITNQNINSIKLDKTNRIWVATEQSGVSVFDGSQWHTYTIQDGLPSNTTFGLTVDENNIVWVATLEGVASFDGKVWRVPYSASNNTLFHNKVHAIAFDHTGNIWIGHINDGVSQYDNVSGKWAYHTIKQGGIGGNQIRDIVARKVDAKSPESVWFATADGGISKFERGAWTVYQVKDGLPSNEVHALAIDKYNRIWAATLGGVAYLEGANWIRYDALNTLSIAFGPSCQSCPYNDEHVWTGTEKFGLTHSRLPYLDNEKAIQVQEVCFELEVTKKHICPSLQEAEVNHHQIISATYPISLTSGEKFRFEVVVTPRTPYQLREDTGDTLSNTDVSDKNLFGAYEHIIVKGTIDPGQPFMFTDYDNLLVAPQLANGEKKKTFVTGWRVWMHTRYVGPSIYIVFSVHN